VEEEEDLILLLLIIIIVIIVIIVIGRHHKVVEQGVLITDLMNVITTVEVQVVVETGSLKPRQRQRPNSAPTKAGVAAGREGGGG